MRVLALLTAAALAAASSASGQVRSCAARVEELRSLAGDAGFPLQWTETTMTDGKPLVVSIFEQDGALFLRFRKTGEGLWAEGPARICQAGRELQARISRTRLRIGPAAHWIFRMSAREGASFRLLPLPSGLLRVATPGWSGDFAPTTEQPNAKGAKATARTRKKTEESQKPDLDSSFLS